MNLLVFKETDDVLVGKWKEKNLVSDENDYL